MSILTVQTQEALSMFGSRGAGGQRNTYAGDKGGSGSARIMNSI